MLNHLFTLFLFIIGMLLIVFHFDIENHTRSTCDSDSLRKANKGLLIIGTIFVSLSIAYTICQSKCNCNTTDFSHEMYVGFIFILSGVLVGLSSTIMSQVKNNCAKSTSSPSVILGISITSLVLTAIYLGMPYFNMSDFGIKKSKS